MSEINIEEIKNLRQTLIRSLSDELEVNPPPIGELQNSLAKWLVQIKERQQEMK